MTRRFPVSDHCDGLRFFNPSPQPRSFGDVVRWRRESHPVAWPDWVVDPVFAAPPDSVAAGDVAVTFINHSTFLLRFAEAVVLTDPIFSKRCSPVSWAGPKRARAPGVALSALPRVDVVLISHNHYDHMDLASLRELRRVHGPRFVTSLGNARVLRKVGIEAVELDWWESVEAGGLRITATPARHFSARALWDRDKTLWGGFMIGAAAGRVLFAGDSGAGGHWAEIRERLGAPGVALLPIGAYEPRWFMGPVHMDPGEAVEAHVALGALRSVGMHFGTFRLTEEGIDAPVVALGEAVAGKAGVEFGVLGFGETGVFGV